MIIGGGLNKGGPLNSTIIYGNHMNPYGNPINTINSSTTTPQNHSNINNSYQMPYNLNIQQQNPNLSLMNPPMQMPLQMPLNQYMNMVPGYPYMAPNPNPNIYNPIMMNYNYINQPFPQAQPIIGYNPYHMVNQAPLNNFNRNILQPGNMNKNQPVKLTDQGLYSNPASLPTIHETSQVYTNNNTNNNHSNISKREQDKARIQRSMSSRQRLNDTKNENSVINSNITKMSNISNDNGPNTNPDSFSKRNRNSSYSTRSNYNDDGTYKPYTLRDYKEISSAKIVMGSLGPNTGTKEWEERQLKLKKMEEYATAIKQSHKSALRVKKETPQEVLERQKKEKIESSSRNKSHEYAKLIKPRSRMAYDSSGLDNELRQDSHMTTEISNNRMSDIPVHVYNDNKSKFMQDYQNRNSNNNNNINNTGLRLYDNNRPSQSENNINLVRYGNQNENDNSSNSGESELTRLQRLRDVYNPKINEIKESLFK
jgi:hypothetical protein